MYLLLDASSFFYLLIHSRQAIQSRLKLCFLIFLLIFHLCFVHTISLSLSELEMFGDVHVLAVDDSLVDRKVIERLLRITSCKVTAVDSGRRALQFLGLDEEKDPVGLDGLKVDLVITDYCMPGMTGYELLKKIKESSTLREIPVVIMSSENVLTRINRCLEEGAEDFIVKPVKLSDVKRLKDHMFGDVKEGRQGRGLNKRKSPEASDRSLSPSQPFITSPTPSPPPSPMRSSPPPSLSPSTSLSPVSLSPSVSLSPVSFSPSMSVSPVLSFPSDSSLQLLPTQLSPSPESPPPCNAVLESESPIGQPEKNTCV